MIQQLRFLGMILAVTLLTAGIGWTVSVYNDRTRLQAETGVLATQLSSSRAHIRATERALEAEQSRSQMFLERSQDLTDIIESIVIGGTPDALLHPDLADTLNRLHPLPQ